MASNPDDRSSVPGSPERKIRAENPLSAMIYVLLGFSNPYLVAPTAEEFCGVWAADGDYSSVMFDSVEYVDACQHNCPTRQALPSGGSADQSLGSGESTSPIRTPSSL